MVTEKSDTSPRLTARGRITRSRIVETAAELFYEHGIGQTTNNEIRSTAQVSGSQLNHFFPTREALVDAVLQQRMADAVDPARFPDAGLPHSFSTLRKWADVYLQRYEHLSGGCRVGSIAGETLKSPMDLREHIDQGYERWRLVLRDGLLTMKEKGELTDSADADYLSFVLLSALQGGLLLTQVSGSTTALRAALDGAIQVIRGYATPSAAAGFMASGRVWPED